MKLLKKVFVFLFAASVLTGCSESGKGDFTVLTTPYKQVLTIGIMENGVEAKYVDPAEFQDFCYAMNNIQTLYKVPEENIPKEYTELLITTRSQKYRIALSSPNIRVADQWFVVDDDTKTLVDIMQDITVNHQVKN